MDEPTAALNGEESERLFRLIDALRARGCGIIYVSHRLDEVLAIADTISLLRDGEDLRDPRGKGGDQGEAGRADDWPRRPKRREAARPYRTRLRSFSQFAGLAGRGVSGLSFDLRAGEILGVVGLADAGADQVTTLLSSGAAEGEVCLDGAPVVVRGPFDAWAKGIALVPRERRDRGAVSR